jgi:hypothetical protein
MKMLYGTIGYTIFENNTTRKKVIIFADKHDDLESCPNNIDIAVWFKTKFPTSKILLEEVPRNNVELEELWPTAKHTQSLKKIYLNNPKIITGLDIRPTLIPFSWEIIFNDTNIDPSYNITFKEYIKNIDNFFSMKDPFFKNNLLNYNVTHLKNTNIGKHFKKIKNNYSLILNKYLHYLNKNIKTKKSFLNDINDLLDEIMEWNICANIILHNKNKSVIVHVGLAHSEKIILLLKNHYKYKFISNKGINKLDDTIYFEPTSGCIQLDNDSDSQFGGN